jgi:hypothetical protein
MLLASAPTQLVLPWGNGDSLKTSPIPVPSQIGVTPGAASWTDGFPPLCATPVTSGGVPPAKADMNGGLYQMSAIDVWVCAGGGFPYKSAFSTAIGGYPQGARVLMAGGLGYWRSLVDNNTVNPNTIPYGATWLQELDPVIEHVKLYGQTAAVGPTVLYTDPMVNGLYRVTFQAEIVAAGWTAGTLQAYCTATSGGGVGITMATTTVNLNTVGGYIQYSQVFDCEGAQAISFGTTLAGASGGPGGYTLKVALECLINTTT